MWICPVWTLPNALSTPQHLCYQTDAPLSSKRSSYSSPYSTSGDTWCCAENAYVSSPKCSSHVHIMHVHIMPRSCRQWLVQLFSSWKERSVLSPLKKYVTTCALFPDISNPIKSKSLFATIKHHLPLKSAPKRVPNVHLRLTMTRVPRCVCVWAWVYVSGRGRGNGWERKKGKPRLCNTWNNRNHLSLLLNHNRDKKTHTLPERADGISACNVFA